MPETKISRVKWSVTFGDETMSGEGVFDSETKEGALTDSMGIIMQQIDSLIQKIERKKLNVG